MQFTYKPPNKDEGVVMFEKLLARGNNASIVAIHRGKIAKITPVRKADGAVCAGGIRPADGMRDNGRMLARLFAEDFGEYYVVVCYGLITEVSPVEKEEAIKVQDVVAFLVAEDDEAINEVALLTVEDEEAPKKRNRRKVAEESPGG